MKISWLKKYEQSKKRYVKRFHKVGQFWVFLPNEVNAMLRIGSSSSFSYDVLNTCVHVDLLKYCTHVSRFLLNVNAGSSKREINSHVWSTVPT